jgi:hypothetical protein
MTTYFLNSECNYYLCAGCGQPFPINDGKAEAKRGADRLLYCWGLTCEDDKLYAAAKKKRSLN